MGIDMGYFKATNCEHLDKNNQCRHPLHARSNWNPLRWLLGKRTNCVFVEGFYSADGFDGIKCKEKEEVKRPNPPKYP